MARDLGAADIAGKIMGILEELSHSPKVDLPLTKVHLRIFELTMQGVPYETIRENWLERFASEGGQAATLERAWGEIHSSAFLRALLKLGTQDASARREAVAV
jgi:hypothetical protein